MAFDDSMSTSITDSKPQDGDQKSTASSTPDEIIRIKVQNEKAKEMHLLKQKHAKD